MCGAGFTIEFCQPLWMIKEQIGGVLGLGCAPVVTLLEGATISLASG
jgi:hypothetical protein